MPRNLDIFSFLSTQIKFCKDLKQGRQPIEKYWLRNWQNFCMNQIFSCFQCFYQNTFACHFNIYITQIFQNLIWKFYLQPGKYFCLYLNANFDLKFFLKSLWLTSCSFNGTLSYKIPQRELPRLCLTMLWSLSDNIPGLRNSKQQKFLQIIEKNHVCSSFYILNTT